MGKTAKENGSTKTNSKIKHTPSLIQKIPYKKWQFWAIVGGACAAIVVLVLLITHKDYKIEDLTGKSVNEACNIARSHGWTVKEPIQYGGNSQAKEGLQVTCDNTSREVMNKYTYDTENHTLELKWDYHKLSDSKGKTVSEVCKEIEAFDLILAEPSFTVWQYRLGYQFDAVTSCSGTLSTNILEEYQNNDSNAIVGSIVQIDEEIYLGVKAVEDPQPESTSKCISGTTYNLKEYHQSYTVGKDIPAGTYKRMSEAFNFKLYDNERAFAFDSYAYINMHDSDISLIDGQIIDEPYGAGYLVCK